MRFIFLLLGILSILYACNEEITVGSSLLEDGAIDVNYTDTLALTGKVVESNRVIAYRSSSSSTNNLYLLGQLTDPVFGNSSSELYLSSRLENTVFPNFDTLSIDSVIMVLPLDTLGIFGQDNAMHTLSVYQLRDRLNTEDRDTIYADEQFEIEATELGRISKTISHRDSFEIFSPNDDTIVRIPPQLRIPLDTSLWHEIANDTLISRNDEMYRDAVRGFLVRSENSDNAMLGINLATNSAASIQFYYSADDTTHRIYFFDLGTVRSSYFTHDYSGTPVETSFGDSLSTVWYLQQMMGPNIEIDLSSVKDYADKVINRATLELFVLDEGSPDVELVEELEAYYINDSGQRTLVFDKLVQNAGTAIPVFGGELESRDIDGNNVSLYSVDISNHVNLIVSGEIESSKIIIQASGKLSGARRTILYSYNSQDFPARLKLVSSNP